MKADYKNWVPKGMAAGAAGMGAFGAWCVYARRMFSYEGDRQLSRQIVEGTAELAGWSDRFASVTSRGYMTGYRDLGKAIPWLYRRMCSLCDGFVSMQIVRIAFAG